MTATDTFLWAAAGSIGHELRMVLGLFEQSTAKGAPALPRRYRSRTFWAARGLWVAVAGLLAVACGPSSAMGALAIGIAAPQTFRSLAHVAARRPRPGTRTRPHRGSERDRPPTAARSPAARRPRPGPRLAARAADAPDGLDSAPRI
ncbi:MAG TPA: hypothetical protein VKW76_06945 [Candidatus Binatia bacterium]|nr:hypothetical protein [Candidatus Binatia bacterium]